MVRIFVMIAMMFAAHLVFSQKLTPLPTPILTLKKDSAALDSGKTITSAKDTVNDSISYTATRIRFRNDRFSLSDKALLKYKGTSLTADSIVFYQDEDIVEATGAPLINDPTNPPILGYRMRYNLNTKVGSVYYGSSNQDRQHFNGMEIRRQPNSSVYISRGDFSTCDQVPDKHFYFYARRMVVEPASKVLSGPIVMNIADVPVAILPMMVLPLGKGRRSGLMQPKFGGDQSQGFYLTGLGYYWAISDYMDFLISGDLIEGQRGTFDKTNLNTTYQWNKRYVWSGMLSGKAYVSEFDPSKAGGVLDFRNDLNVTPDGRQTLKGSGRLQTDPAIVENNAITESERLQQTANATLGYRRQFDWNQATLNLDLMQDHNLTQNNLNRSIPDGSFHVGGPLFPLPDLQPGDKDPWYTKWTWDYGNRFNVYQVSRPTLNTHRGDSNTYAGYSDHVTLSGKYSASQYVNLTPSLNLAQLWSLYSKTGDSTQPFRAQFEPGQGEVGEYFLGWNTGISADTRFYGIAQAQEKPWLGRVSALRHTVTPSVRLTYAPELKGNPRYYANPKIGGIASQAEQRTVGMQLGNDIDMKIAHPDSGNKKPESYKLFTSSNSLSYNFADKTRPWSELSSTVTLYLTRNVGFTLNAIHVLYDPLADSAARNTLVSPILKSWGFGWRKGLEAGGGLSTGTRIRDTRGAPTEQFETSPWSVSLNYGFDFSARRVGTQGGNDAEKFFGKSELYEITRTHQASGGLHLNPTAGWKMNYDTEFNFSEGEFSRHVFGFERTLHCWRMNFNWTPTGVSEGWSFVIRIIDLPDVKLETSDSRGLRRNR